MKFLSILLGLFMFVTFEANAQTITSFTGSDTIVNTATVNCDLILRNYYSTGVFQVTNTKLSGTVAGKTYFQGSVDGTNYVKLDSITNTNQTTNTQVFNQSPPRYPYYRFAYTGTGTMSAIMVAKAHFKK
ncbi:MAG: hypothetical protein WAT92_00325 [Saprospiraceae bacterium]